MTEVLLAALAGLLVGAGLWATGGDLFHVESLRRTNYRGAEIATGVGALVPVATLVVVAAGHLALLSTGRGPVWYAQGRTAVLATAGFGLLGLLDDVAGAGQSGGFRQHLRALWHGRLTSGGMKLFAGGAVGVLVAAAVPGGDTGLAAGLRDGAVVALAANLANLFDRAPGRCIKFTTTAFGVAAVVARRSELAGPAVGIGAGLALLVPDLREKAMLGDAGANPLGALAGLAWLVALPDPAARWALLVVLVAANAASEVVSYSAVIDRVGPLRWFDRLGSLRA
jgi:UDP-GlcNAc:undecaprenyl-phosphate GlcNAc-1-phosphate transferase